MSTLGRSLASSEDNSAEKPYSGVMCTVAALSTHVNQVLNRSRDFCVKCGVGEMVCSREEH